jgi:CO/xanthine dehydrogenase Mo-binding subunit
MTKHRSLPRVIQEHGKFLFNQEKENAWHCRLLRATGEPGQSFSVSVPEWNDQAFLITARDLGKHRHVKFFRDSLPMLADRTVDYTGQVIAILLAPHPDKLLACEQEIRVSYGPPPAATEPDGETWHCRRIVRSGELVESVALGMRAVDTRQQWRLCGFHYYEPRGAIAEWKSDMLWVQCSSSWPHMVRRLVSESTGLPQKNITVISLPSGTLPDRFLLDSSILACYASMGALTCMKRVELFLSSLEDSRFATRHAPVNAHFTTLHAGDGRIHSLKATVEIDCGAWPLGAQESMQTCLAGLCSTYLIPNQEIEVRLMRSARPPALLPEGFGLAQMQLLMERHMAAACAELDLDQHEFRVDHLLTKNDTTPYGPNPDPMQAAHQVLEHVSRVSDFSRKYAAAEQLRRHRPDEPHLTGIGIALAFQSHGLHTGFELANRARVRLVLGADRHLVIHAPMHASHTALREAWVDELSEVLGIEERHISFCRFSSDQIDDSGPIRFSRLATQYTPLLAMAARSLRQKMARQTGPIEIKLSMPNLRRLKWDEDNFSGAPFLGRSWAAAAVELDIDPVRLLPVVSRVCVTVNAGAVLLPLRAIASVKQSVRECLAVQGCQPGPVDRIEVEFLGHERYMVNDQRFLHAGGIGELAAATIPAAVANALTQILGPGLATYPASPQEIHRLLRNIGAPAQEPPPSPDGISGLEEILA